jgi:hypothetical protein
MNDAMIQASPQVGEMTWAAEAAEKICTAEVAEEIRTAEVAEENCAAEVAEEIRTAEVAEEIRTAEAEEIRTAEAEEIRTAEAAEAAKTATVSRPGRGRHAAPHQAGTRHGVQGLARRAGGRHVGTRPTGSVARRFAISAGSAAMVAIGLNAVAS